MATLPPPDPDDLPPSAPAPHEPEGWCVGRVVNAAQALVRDRGSEREDAPVVPCVGEADLVAAGVSLVGIQRLRALREEYPWREWTDSGRQWDRVRFARWRYAKGQLSE